MTVSASPTPRSIPTCGRFMPRLSPYTTAIASGTIRVVGSVYTPERAARRDHRRRPATCGSSTTSCATAAPLRVGLDGQVRARRPVRLTGDRTALELSGQSTLRDDVAVRVNGDANLACCRACCPTSAAPGAPRCRHARRQHAGADARPATRWTATGGIRSFGLPHALENILGIVISIPGGAARRPERAPRRRHRGSSAAARHRGLWLGPIDVTLNGDQMRLRFPEGMRSLVDAVPDAARHDGRRDAQRSGGRARRASNGARSTPAAIFDFAARRATAAAVAGAASATTTVPLRYDVSIVAPSTLQVRNDSIRLTARADLQLRGTYDRPLLAGRADVERGEVTFEGRRYLVTRGSSTSATRRVSSRSSTSRPRRASACPVDTYRVTLQASGTIDRLNLEFSSDPWLPQVDILSLLFSDVAPGRNVELAAGTAPTSRRSSSCCRRARRARSPGRCRPRSAGSCSRPSGWTPSR